MKRTLAQLASPEKDLVFDDANTVHTSKHTDEVVAKSVPKVGEHHDGSFQVYMAHKVTKLREIHSLDESEKVSDIFKGCIMYVNGITDPPKEELRRLVSLHGGECIAYRVVNITHLICDHYTDAQLKAEYAKVRPAKMGAVLHVTAKWVLDCVAKRQRISEVKYSPPGFSNARFGGSISSMFASNSNNTSSSSSSSKSNKASTSLTPTTLMVDDILQTIVYEEITGTKAAPSSSSSSSSSSDVALNLSLTPEELTLSQQDMMQQCSDLPEEVKSDMLAQFKQVNRDKRARRSLNTANSSSKSVARAAVSGPSVNQDRLKSRDAMLKWIQVDPNDDIDAARAFVPRMKHYITTLINLQSGNRRPCAACHLVNSSGFSSASQFCDEQNRYFDFAGRGGKTLAEVLNKGNGDANVSNARIKTGSSSSSSSASVDRYVCTCTTSNRHIRPPKVVTVDLIEDLLDWLSVSDPLSGERIEIVKNCIVRAVGKLMCCKHTDITPISRYCGRTAACCRNCVAGVEEWMTFFCK